MPNVPPMGLFGLVPGLSPGTPTEAVDVVATLVGETAPRNALEVWATAPGSTVPKLVWSRAAGVPAAPLTQTYNGGTGFVTVGWVAPNPTKQDSFDVKRPDGSLVGSVSAAATSIVDSAPLPLNGAYTVTARLAGLSGTPTATPTLNLAAAPGALTATFQDNRPASVKVHLVWSAPAYGNPHQYQIWRNGALYTTVAGTATTYDDLGVLFGSSPSYTVYPVLSGVRAAGSSTASVAIPQDPPTGVALSNPAADTLRLSWAAPSMYSYFEVQRYDNTVGVWTAHTTTAALSSDWNAVNPGYMRVRAVSATGVASGFVQAGPVTPKPPPPTILAYINCSGACAGGHSGDSFYNEFLVQTTYSGVQPTFCAEYFWSGFPGSGWQDAGGCQPGDNIGGSFAWFPFRLQLTPTYARTKQVRWGVDSDWNQTGAL